MWSKLFGFTQAICALSPVCIVCTVYGIKRSSLQFTLTLLVQYTTHNT